MKSTARSTAARGALLRWIIKTTGAYDVTGRGTLVGIADASDTERWTTVVARLGTSSRGLTEETSLGVDRRGIFSEIGKYNLIKRVRIRCLEQPRFA